MKDKYKHFYELAGKYYPEDDITYSSLSGLLRKKWVINKLKTMSPGNLLDCGCNIGRLGAYWKRGDIYGIDISFSVLQKGKKIFPEINFIQGDLRALEFIRKGTIDNAIVIEVIEHLDKPLALLKGLYHILRKDGLVLITAPNYSYFRPGLVNLGIIRSFGINQGTKGKRYLHTAYKPGELALMAEQIGFTVVEKGSFEHELKGWAKPLTIITNIFDVLSAKFFPESKLNYLFVRTIHGLELNIFSILETFFFSKILRKIFKEGRRSYVLAQKR